MEDHDVIALECDKLESIVTVGLEEFNNSHAALGKSWYALGLEDDASDKQKDGGNKRNILLRLIDRIVAFIKSIGAKIAEWYRKCRAAIMKFFGKKTELDPRNVSKRFDMLVQSLDPKYVDTIISSTSEGEKRVFAEILSRDYNTAFNSLFDDYKALAGKIHNVNQFAENHNFFVEFKKKHAALKDIAEKDKIYEKMDESFNKLLHGQGNSGNVEAITKDFNEINAAYSGNAAQLEKLLKEIPNHSFEHLEGSDDDAKRQSAVRLLSDILKIDGEIVLRVNQRMASVSKLMQKIVKRNYKRLIIIPH